MYNKSLQVYCFSQFWGWLGSVERLAVLPVLVVSAEWLLPLQPSGSSVGLKCPKSLPWSRESVLNSVWQRRYESKEAEVASSLKAWAWKSQNITFAAFSGQSKSQGQPTFKGRENRLLFLMRGVVSTLWEKRHLSLWRFSSATNKSIDIMRSQVIRSRSHSKWQARSHTQVWLTPE